MMKGTLESPNQRFNYNSSPATLLAIANIVSDPAWFADTRTNNHITSDKGNLTSASDYTGKEKVMVGNGSKLNISHFVTSHIPALNDKTLVLNKLLHVPEMKKNLISVSQLTSDNQIFMEFHSNCCLVKDLSTKEVMLQGRLKDVLYQLDFPHQSISQLLHQSSFSNKFCYISSVPSNQGSLVNPS